MGFICGGSSASAEPYTHPYKTVFIKLFFRSVFIALLIIALLGPTFGESKREIKSVGKDIMICVDLSKSMDAFDVQPSRLEKVKFEMKKIADAFNSDRLGIIIFSSEAFYAMSAYPMIRMPLIFLSKR